jgi:hypothetical protein
MVEGDGVALGRALAVGGDDTQLAEIGQPLGEGGQPGSPDPVVVGEEDERTHVRRRGYTLLEALARRRPSRR